MSMMTLTLDASAKPTGLVPVATAVAVLARAEQSRMTARARGVDPELLIRRKCQVFYQDDTRLYRSAGNFGEGTIEIPAPLVMMWEDYKPKKGEDWTETTAEERSHVSRRVLFLRDGLRCSYCDEAQYETIGQAMRHLTVDHVKPQRMFSTREQATTWENVCSACRLCNARKGGRLPMECGMMPRNTPKEPHFVQLRFAGRLTHPTQREYVQMYFGLDPEQTLF